MGRDHEITAIEVFTKAIELTVVPTGVWMHECGFLGASPDGLIKEENVLTNIRTKAYLTD